MTHTAEQLLALAPAAAGGALPTLPPLRSPSEREEAFRREHRAAWTARRARATPAPFGDPVSLAEGTLPWLRESGAAAVIQAHQQLASGESSFGRPDVGFDQRTYDFAALVAVWCDALPRPAALEGTLPTPRAKLLPHAVAAALALLPLLEDESSELRMMWEEGEDGGRAFHAHVASLRTGLEAAARRLGVRLPAA